MSISTSKIATGLYRVVDSETKISVIIEKLGIEHGDLEGSWCCYLSGNNFSGNIHPNKKSAVYQAVTYLNNKREHIKQVAVTVVSEKVADIKDLTRFR